MSLTTITIVCFPLCKYCRYLVTSEQYSLIQVENMFDWNKFRKNYSSRMTTLSMTSGCVLARLKQDAVQIPQNYGLRMSD